MTEVTVISGRDIRARFGAGDFIDAVASAYGALATGGAELTPKFHWEFSVGRGAAFGAYLPASASAVVKIASIRPDNPSRGLPRGILQIVVQDAETGEPRAILDGSAITALRTGAAAAAGARALARADSEVVALVGAGVVARAAADALLAVFHVGDLRIVGRGAGGSADELVAALRESGVPARAVESAEVAVHDADIIVTATPATTPVVMDSWVAPGTHLSAMGADWRGKQELETALLRRSRLFVDRREQSAAIGELNVPLQNGDLASDAITAEIGEVISGSADGRTNDHQVTVFDSSGIGVQDLAAADVVLRAAVRDGWGQTVEL